MTSARGTRRRKFSDAAIPRPISHAAASLSENSPHAATTPKELMSLREELLNLPNSLSTCKPAQNAWTHKLMNWQQNGLPGQACQKFLGGCSCHQHQFPVDPSTRQRPDTLCGDQLPPLRTHSAEPLLLRVQHVTRAVEMSTLRDSKDSQGFL